jgi:hypothetical protein
MWLFWLSAQHVEHAEMILYFSIQYSSIQLYASQLYFALSNIYLFFILPPLWHHILSHPYRTSSHVSSLLCSALSSSVMFCPALLSIPHSLYLSILYLILSTFSHLALPDSHVLQSCLVLSASHRVVPSQHTNMQHTSPIIHYQSPSHCSSKWKGKAI